jgi:phosphatidylethanolamine-binding protein (PEBP) family uncharacterized protein
MATGRRVRRHPGPCHAETMSVLATVVTPLGRLLRNKRADESRSVRHAPALAASRTIDLSAPAFGPGGVIPDRHCSMDLGPNISPELRWTGVPAGAAQLLLIMEDIDVPMSRPALHLIALLSPATPGLDEGALTPDNPAIRWVPAFRGSTGYQGPRPLPGHGVHRYGFHLYALERAIAPDRSPAGLDDLLTAVDGQVLADGFLEGVKTG